MCGSAPCTKPNCTWSRQHLEACEAKTLMKWPAEKRAAYYAEVEKKRGRQALEELKRRVGQAWKINQQPSLL